MDKKGMILMQKYEVGRLLGQGTFAKVYYAKSLASGQVVAIKIIDKEKVFKVGMSNQIEREISVMRLVHHPNIVQLYEVMATKAKIYFVMEYVNGGELFNKVAKGRLKENAARKYFQQLIEAVDFCHSRGVYHRDLKPENLLLDENGNLKISDFGLSALKESHSPDKLLHTTCGTPAYVAPEIINKKGYDGAKADMWSCGVILYVLLAGTLPFQDSNLMGMYKKIMKGEFRCPPWFTSDVRKLLTRILDPNPNSRITIDKLVENPWFRKEYQSANTRAKMKNSISLPNMQSYSIDQNDKIEESDQRNETSQLLKPGSYNAFDIISMSGGFNLSGLFTEGNASQPEARFMTQKSASAIVSKLEEIAHTENFKIMKKDGIVKLEGCKEGRKGQLEIDAEIFEVGPSFHLIEVKKTAGDTMEYQKFCNQDLRPSLKDMAGTLARYG